MGSSLRIVLDTNVFISAYFWEGNERNVLRKCRDGDFQLVVSPEILDELAKVLDLKFDVLKSNIDDVFHDW